MKPIVIGKCLAAAVTICVPLLANANTDVWISTGETKCFPVNSEETATLHYAPQQIGTRCFSTWHQTTIAWDKVAAMDFYWRDLSGNTS